MTPSVPAAPLAPQQQAFIDKRRRLIRVWRYTGPVVLLLVLGFTAYLAIRTPLLINPFEVISKLEADTLPDSTLVVMAAMLPVIFAGTLILLLAIVALLYAALGNEKKYLAVIDGLQGTGD